MSRITVDNVRSILRDPANRTNSVFLQRVLELGILHPDYKKASPPVIGRMVKQDASSEVVSLSIGSNRPVQTSAVVDKKINNSIIPNPKYNPLKQSEISARTKLSDKITLAKFINADVPSKLFKNRDLAFKQQTSKYLYAHAMFLEMIRDNEDEFEGIMLEVSESIYQPGKNEIVTKDSINFKKFTGHAVVYKVIDKSGKVNNKRTFDLAAYYKDTALFDEMILSYDTFEGEDKLTSRLIIVMPDLDVNWNGEFNRNVFTDFNNIRYSRNELVECLSLADCGEEPVNTGAPYDLAKSSQWLLLESGEDWNVDPVLLAKCTAVAQKFGQPLFLIDGRRPPKSTEGVGKTSQHILGKAVDLDLSKFSQRQRQKILDLAIAEGINGVGVYNNSMHFDTRAIKTAWGPGFTGRGLRAATNLRWALVTLSENAYSIGS